MLGSEAFGCIGEVGGVIGDCASWDEAHACIPEDIPESLFAD